MNKYQTITEPTTVKTVVKKLTLFPGSKINSKWVRDMVGVTTGKGKFQAHLEQHDHFKKLLNTKGAVTLKLVPCYYHKSLPLAS
jgi:hypothetical protein